MINYILILTMILFFNCRNDLPQKQEYIYWLIGDSHLSKKSNLVVRALDRWELGLRWMPLLKNEKVRHMVTVSKDLKCLEQELKDYRDKCNMMIGEDNMKLGVCFNDNEGEKIKSSIIVINDKLFNLFTEDAATDIITHEIGHCLGLIHVPFSDNLMFPFYEGQSNIEPQKTLLKLIYISRIFPSKTVINIYFDSLKNDKILIHEILPIFRIDMEKFKD